MFGNIGDTMRAGVQGGRAPEMTRAAARLYWTMSAGLLLAWLLTAAALWLARGLLPPLGPNVATSLLGVTALLSGVGTALLEIECRRRIDTLRASAAPAEAHKKSCATVLATAATLPTAWSGTLLLSAFLVAVPPPQGLQALALLLVLVGVGWSRLRPLCELAAALRPASAGG